MTDRTALMISTAILVMAWQVPAHAQDMAPASTNASSSPVASGDEIIVTAQKRSQTLLEVPESISVVSGATLEAEHANSFEDYLKLVPGLQLNQSQAGAGRLVLRGINTGGDASTVAVYVDDTPFGSSSGLVNGAVLASDFDTFDIARIEVLRGPQGTLYGANSLGGLLKFVTNAPDPSKFELRVRGGVETTDGGKASYYGNGVVNIPLGETLAFRASGYYRHDGGFIDSIGTPLVVAGTTLASEVQNNINSANNYGGRAAVLFDPSANFNVRLTAILQDIRGNAPDLIESDPVHLQELNGRPTEDQFVPQFRRTAYRLYNGTANLDLGLGTLTSVTSYATLNQNSLTDVTTYLNTALGGALGVVDFGEPETQRQHKFTQELRLASSKSKVFDWLVGGYYTHETGQINQSFQAYNPGTLTQVAGLPLLATVVLPSKYNEIAGFANGTIYLSEAFDLTLGGRYSHNHQHAQQSNDGILAGGASTLPDTQSSDNVFTFSASPKFNFSKNASIYARVAKGYRPGGPNVLPANPPVGTPTSFASDSVISYEGGVKAETPDHSFSIDIDGYHIDWRHIQLLTEINGFGVNQNGGAAQSDGGEFTAVMRPVAGFALTVNGAYTKARLKQTTNLLVGGFAGDDLPYTPRYSIGVDGNYEWSVGGDARAFVGASLRSLSQQTGDYDYLYRTTYGRQRQIPAYEVADARLGLDIGKYEIELYGKNLTNALGRTSALATFPTPSEFPNGALQTGIIRPRTFGVSVTAGF